METRPPTALRILIAVGFAISCFALALFLWVAFGGPVPLASEGYRVHVPFDEATQLAQESDVRISGVSVGKVKLIELNDDGMAEATIELDSAFAPIPSDTTATLRQKTLLGETYVELSPGSDEAEPLDEDGDLPAAQVSESVQIDEVFRTFDEPTRQAFQSWMQTQAAALKGRGEDFSQAIGSLEPFARQATEALRILDSDEQAVQGFVSNGGEVFEALSERQGQLSGLISASKQVFETTANRNAELEEIFRIFPTFLRESRLTLARLEKFAIDTNPLVTQLRPAVRELSPTLESLAALAPDLEAFLRAFDNTITASKDGLPALQDLLDEDLRPLLARIDPYFAELNAFLETIGMYKAELAALLANGSAVTQGTRTESDNVPRHHLRTSSVFGPQSLAAYDNRLSTDRSNPYLQALGYLDLPGGLDSFETRQCASGDQALLDDGDAGAFPGNLYDRLKFYAFRGQNDSDNLPAPPCTQQPDFDSIGENPEQTQYLHVREKE
ncbi:MAG: phospholipid/cholesterol/gamma-HCH transport system substrate-binding protein [Solirubrobacterales bacterium]|jgi:virulence factor Mce-like protein|nr:phospholipid/cholesterol/gamma-HCH transport system substrate-binding protein [Solirubrobacterales bacterium]